MQRHIDVAGPSGSSVVGAVGGGRFLLLAVCGFGAGICFSAAFFGLILFTLRFGLPATAAVSTATGCARLDDEDGTHNRRQNRPHHWTQQRRGEHGDGAIRRESKPADDNRNEKKRNEVEINEGIRANVCENGVKTHLSCDVEAVVLIGVDPAPSSATPAMAMGA